MTPLFLEIEFFCRTCMNTHSGRLGRGRRQTIRNYDRAFAAASAAAAAASARAPAWARAQARTTIQESSPRARTTKERACSFVAVSRRDRLLEDVVRALELFCRSLRDLCLRARRGCHVLDALGVAREQFFLHVVTLFRSRVVFFDRPHMALIQPEKRVDAIQKLFHFPSLKYFSRSST